MKKIYLITGVIVLIVLAVVILGKNNLSEKVYVAVEGKGIINVIDPSKNKSVKVIDLVDKESGTSYLPHNVQASPDGKSVWVTANAGMEKHNSRIIPVAHANEGHEGMNMQISDQVIVIDPKNDTVIKRIPLGAGQHLSHVVFTSDSKTAVVVAQETDTIYQIQTDDFLVKNTIALPKGSGPHGLRLSPDGKTAYVAFMEGKGLGIVNLTSGTIEARSLNGSAVQTAVTSDGKKVAVSIYDTKNVAVYDTATKSIDYVVLPDGAQGPVQLYPTSDSRFVYIADQGVLQNRPANDKLYKLDMNTNVIVESITVGSAPHGVVVSDDDRKVYVTNLEAGTVSVVDTATGKEIAQISVGEKPNGITIWKGKRKGKIRLEDMSSREIALRSTTDMATEYHIHPELSIFVNGEEISVPNNLGVTSVGMTAIHTHDEKSIIHVESPIKKDFTLGDFFAVWGKDFSSTQLLDKTVDGNSEIIVTVNGKKVDTYENTVLLDKDKIVIHYQNKQ